MTDVDIQVAKYGMGMTEATLVEWIVGVGGEVAAGEPGQKPEHGAPDRRERGGGDAADREGSQRCHRPDQPRHEQEGNHRPHGVDWEPYHARRAIDGA